MINSAGSFEKHRVGRLAVAKRAFRDAPAWARCGMAIRLKDGTWAQCGRWRNENYYRNPSQQGSPCTQHGDMYFAGKTVHLWRDGHPVIKLLNEVTK